ncbi:MAG: hypothetical protein Q7K21_00305, partial [Elusimicrobiota bacterium]|nr:hypothetical protein [Elusimicrobiota bacterium]
MGWLSILIGIITSWLFYRSNQITLFLITIVFTVISFWSWGIMHNYATEAAKKRATYKGDFYDFTEQEVNSIPNWIVNI